MYEKFYGLHEAPFNLTPDSRFLFLSHHHREAMAALLYGVRERKGFTLLSGEIGSGKTMLCRALVKELEVAGVQVALVLDSYVSDVELLMSINQELGTDVPVPPARKTLVDALYRFLVEQNRKNINVVVMIDEAQNLADSVLEQIRLLGNLETEQRKLLQIVLVGQPELARTLQEAKLEQLNQRIAVRYHLRPFDPDEVEPYIQHRLRIAGATTPIQFTQKAVDLIYEYTGGIPRKINLLCDRALLSGYVATSFVIDEAIIRTAAVEVGADQWAAVTNLGSGGMPPRTSKLPSVRTLAYAFAVVILIALLPMLYKAAGLLAGDGKAEIADAANPAGAGTPKPGAPAPAPTPTPAVEPAAATPADDAASGPFILTPKPYEGPWTYDQDDIVRVDRRQYAKTAAVLTLLRAWGFDLNLQEFRDGLPPENDATTDVIKINSHKGLRAAEIPGNGLPKALNYDVPVVVELSDPERRLSPYVTLLAVTPRTCVIADPVHGKQVLPRELMSLWWQRAWAVYFDTDGYGSLRRGQKSEAVRSLQSDLRNLGFYRRPITDELDSETVSAINFLQRQFNLYPIDGYLEDVSVLDGLTVMLITSHRQPDRPRLTERKEAEP